MDGVVSGSERVGLYCIVLYPSKEREGMISYREGRKCEAGGEEDDIDDAVRIRAGRWRSGGFGYLLSMAFGGGNV